MEIDPKYAYFILDIPYLIIWSVIFILSKKTRKEQLIMSLLFSPVATIYEILYFQDYWNPGSILSFNIGSIRILLEDFLFFFAFSGISAVIYEVIFNKRFFEIKRSINVVMAIIFIIGIGILVSYSLFLAGMNSIFATSIGFVTIALFIISQRKDLLVNSLVSGLAMMVIMFIIYAVGFNLLTNIEHILQQIWHLYKTPLGVRIWKIPITEMVWGFSAGMFFGPLYELIKKKRTS